MFDLPLKEPVIIFAVAMITFLTFPFLMRKLRIPGIIGPIIAGVIIGPDGLNLLARDETIQLLGTVGLLFIIFIAGLELDLDGFKKYRKRSLVFGLFSFYIPLLFGTVFGLLLGYGMAASILLGSILGSHTLLGYPIASRLGIGKNKAITTAVGGSILTDTFALLVLAIVAGSVEGELTIQFFVTLLFSLCIFVAVVLVGVPFISKIFFKNASSEGTTEFIYVMVVLFTAGFLAIVAGLQPIIGAFLAGISLNRYIFEQSPLMNRIRFSANALFIPFFLLSVGMLMDLQVLISSPKAWIFTAAILVGVIGGKYLAALLTSVIYKYNRNQRLAIFGLTIPQAAATLAATLVGFKVGLLDQTAVNGVIIMILITCIIGPYLVEKFGRKLALEEEQQPYKRADAPERILIPLSNAKAMESLMDLAFVIKSSSSQGHPLYPLAVVEREVEAAEKEVAKAEKMLGQAVMYASGADIPIKLLTRVDHNVASGIVRAATEERITTVIAEWDGERTTPRRIFGSTIDQMLEQTYQTVLISKLNHPLNTTKRVVLVLPKGIDHKQGYEEALIRIKTLTSKLGATLWCLILKDDTKKYAAFIEELKPNPPTTFEFVEGWSVLFDNYLTNLDDDDLIIVISSRQGTTAWHPKLEELPYKLSKVNPESFIVYYPTEEEEIDLRGTRGTELPREFLRKKDYDDE
ncbi:cation:proton antiporter [Bacillus sp. CGMCC 1.16541]|uniref:cation:proton antiporter domain-containing protein n=1 Tax=Bacillus sp. CGMCC 1.16541 TaxID=2185143 RepID=UPI000D72D773|nr:cation:proton antiporter [Bacillus sp. CGMCC 1.16541]